MAVSLADRFPPQLVTAVGPSFATLPEHTVPVNGTAFHGIDRLPFTGAIKGVVEGRDGKTCPFMAVHVRAKDPSQAPELDTCIVVFQRFVVNPENPKKDVDDSPEQQDLYTNYRLHAFSTGVTTGRFLGNVDMPLNRSALEGIQRLFEGTDPNLRIESAVEPSGASAARDPA